jgi:hypothetical protein
MAMGTFEEREKSSERKFQQDQELAFKVKARRNRLLGLWAAQCLGLSGDEAQRYAQQVMQADLEKPGTADIVGKVSADFKKHGVAHDEVRVRVELDRCAAEAKKQLGPQ